MNKDIINLILYIMALCLTIKLITFTLGATLVYGLDLVTKPPNEILFAKYPPVSSLIFIFGMFCIITSFFFPVIITKLFLDKNWSKYLTYFFNNIQHPTIVFICYILVRQFIISINLIEANKFFFCDLPVYSVYTIVLIRKFINPVYKYFWILYSIFTIGFIFAFIFV